tara:strand:+ start:180 stop:797 length:618 start_codon:yes stop_codon:yes gene_type:complete
MTGKFITLEGIEGSGKSTSLKDITDILKEKSIKFITTKEPGGGPLGKDLRAMLLNKDLNISPEVELFLMMADRKNHLDNIIMPNIENGTWVVSDRYLDSTYAYQGGGRKMDSSVIDNLSSYLNLPTPNLTLLFDLPPEIALERAKQRSSLDRFEREPLDFHTRIRNTYNELASTHSKRFRTIDSSQGFPEVKKQVTSVMLNFIND